MEKRKCKIARNTGRNTLRPQSPKVLVLVPMPRSMAWVHPPYTCGRKSFDQPLAMLAMNGFVALAG
jgi:hypothetical protein